MNDIFSSSTVLLQLHLLRFPFPNCSEIFAGSTYKHVRENVRVGKREIVVLSVSLILIQNDSYIHNHMHGTRKAEESEAWRQAALNWRQWRWLPGWPTVTISPSVRRSPSFRRPKNRNAEDFFGGIHRLRWQAMEEICLTQLFMPSSLWSCDTILLTYLS